MYVLLYHVKEFIAFQKKSAGFYFEKALEAVHYEYEYHRKKYVDNFNKENSASI